MSPDDIPTEITDKIYSAPFKNRLSQNDVATLLAYFWPSVEQHMAGRFADLLEQRNPDRGAEFSEGVDWAVAELRGLGAGQ